MTGPGSAALTNAEFSPTGFHWGWDTYSQSVSSAKALLDQGFKSWFILTRTMPSATRWKQTCAPRSPRERARSGFGHIRWGRWFSSFLLQGRASGAQVIALANAGADTVNSLKQAADFGIAQGRPAAGRHGSWSCRTCRRWGCKRTGLTFTTSVLLGP